MLTEVPAELSQKGDFKGMIALYVQQLSLLTEMRATILDLFTAGHFQFQEDFTRSFPARTPADVLIHEAERLANISRVITFHLCRVCLIHFSAPSLSLVDLVVRCCPRSWQVLSAELLQHAPNSPASALSRSSGGFQAS